MHVVTQITALRVWPVVSDELHVVSLVTLLDAVHTDGVAVCCVTGVTPAGGEMDTAFVNDHKTGKRLTGSHLDCEHEHQLPVKIVHWVAGVTWNLVQALTSAHSLFNGILIVHYFIIWKRRKQRETLVRCGGWTGALRLVRPVEYLSL